MALTELARYLPRPAHANRYLRGNARQGRRDAPTPEGSAEPDDGPPPVLPSLP